MGDGGKYNFHPRGKVFLLAGKVIEEIERFNSRHINTRLLDRKSN